MARVPAVAREGLAAGTREGPQLRYAARREVSVLVSALQLIWQCVPRGAASSCLNRRGAVRNKVSLPASASEPAQVLACSTERSSVTPSHPGGRLEENRRRNLHSTSIIIR